VTGEDNPQFVLHEYFTHHHHFDFRFEKRGELKSWSEEPEREKIAPLKLPLVGKRWFFYIFSCYWIIEKIPIDVIRTRSIARIHPARIIAPARALLHLNSHAIMTHP
jgi:hypothetical protein